MLAENVPQEKLFSNESALDLRSIIVRYPNGFTAVNDVSLQVGAGHAVALTGSNGSGKSTLLRSLVGLSPLQSGAVTIFGQDCRNARSRDLKKIRSQIGFIFQYHNLVTRLGVLSNVLHGAQTRAWGPRVWFQGLARREDREEAYHCLELVGLADQAAKRADELSGGQAQRVAIARALMQRPKILVADEPAASLDPKAGEEVMELFQKLCREQGITLLYSSHDLEHALHYSDRVVGLRAGVLVLDKASTELSIESLREFYNE